MLGISSSLVKGGASLLTYVKDNLKLYLDFKSKRSDTLKFPCEGSTDFELDSTQYIKIPHSTDLSLGTDPHTIACWAKFESLANYRTLIAKRGTGTDYNLSVGSNGEIYTYNGSATAQSANSVISTGIWYHIALIYSGSAYVLYVDGVVKSWSSGTTTSGSANTDPLYIGWSSNSSEYMDGKMANVGIWSRDLSLEEINSVMNKSYSQLGSVEKTSLVMWQSLDSASNGVVTPSSGETLGSEVNTLANALSPTNETDATTGLTTAGTISSVTSPTTSSTYSIKLVTTENGEGVSASSNYTVEIGKLYKFSITWKTESNDHSMKHLIGTTAGATNYLNLEGVSGSTDWVTSDYYFVTTHNILNFKFAEFTGDSDIVMYIDNISIKKVTSNTGFVTGATTTTSVYGGNAPVLPRAIDIAESQAEQIGNGSALFVKSNTDYVNLGSSLDFNIGASDFTISCWINPNNKSNDAGWDGIVYLGSAASSQGHFGFNPSGNLAMGTGSGGNWVTVESSTTVDLNTWTHVAGTRVGNTLNIYKNGAHVYTAAHTVTPSQLDEDCFIGRGGGTTESYDGYIAQVGVWRGALSQSQIQSVMESTSYAKMPEDVKSTLGSELVTNGTFDSGISNWTDFDSNRGDISYSNGRLRIDNTTGTGEYFVKQTASFESGKLYKIQFDHFLISGSETAGNFYFDASDQSDLSTSTHKVGDTYTIYAKPSANRSYFLIGGASGNAFGDIFELDNISIKEVTNDLVGYWGLDADNSVKAVDFTSGTVGSTTPITAFGTNSFSISTWVKASGSYQSVFMTDTSQVDNCFILTVNMGTKIGIGDNDSWHHLTSDAAGTVANKWHLITYVREGTGTNESKFYVDGVLKHTDTNNINLLSADGWKLGLGSYGYTGQIKELAVFHNKALTATEVLAQYNNGIENNFTTSGMTHHWVLNNATTVTDLVGGNNGTGSSVTLVDAVVIDSTDNNNNGDLL